MATALDREQADRLAAAKLWLLSVQGGDLPYLSTALFALTPVASDAVRAVSTDVHWRLYVNPQWLDTTDVPDIAAELAHQVWHLLADHAARALDVGVTRATAGSWRTAADVTVGEVLGLGGLAERLALPTPGSLRLAEGRSAEEHYARLSRLPTRPTDADEPDSDRDEDDGDEDDGEAGHADCGSGCDGLARSHELSVSDDVPGITTHAAAGVREHVAIEFREHVTTRGTIPGEWARWVEQVLDPVVDWRTVLRASVRRGLGWAAGHTDYTYARISRRQAVSASVVLPALRRRVPSVAVVVDTSGSIDDGLLAQALAEVDGVLSGLSVSDAQVTVLAVDAEVHAVSTVREAKAVALAGGGGTDMVRGIDEALAVHPRPDVIIVLTDGYTPWPAAPGPVPVIAVIMGRRYQDLPPTPPTVLRVACVPFG